MHTGFANLSLTYSAKLCSIEKAMAFHQGACDCLKSNCLSQKEYERWLGISGEIESLEYHFLSLFCSKSCRVKEIQALFLSSQNFVESEYCNSWLTLQQC